METNENVKNENLIKKNVENVTDKSEVVLENNLQQNQQVNFEATQRIELLSEIIKETINSETNNLNSMSNQVIDNSNSQELNINNMQEVSKEEIVENQNNDNIAGEEHISEQNNCVNVASEEQVVENENVINIASQNQVLENKTVANIISEQSEVQNNNSQINEIQPNDQQEIDKKQKQHNQDKKDYRLERMLFDRINKMQGKIKESIELIKKFERINAKEENLPNIVTTLHDKLTQEVIKQFRTVGIEFNMKSFLVQSIVSDLLNKFEEGITDFKNCSENLNFVREVQEDFESKVELAPTSKVKNIFARLRGLFKPERKQERLEQLERERQEKKLEEANINLIKYKFKNSELERYTIRKNIVSSLCREMLYGPSAGLNLSVEEFINTRIASEMKKLGLDNLLDELKDKLYAEYNEKCQGISKEEFLISVVGDVKKNMKFNRVGYLRSKVTDITSGNVQEEEEIAI